MQDLSRLFGKWKKKKLFRHRRPCGRRDQMFEISLSDGENGRSVTEQAESILKVGMFISVQEQLRKKRKLMYFQIWECRIF